MYRYALMFILLLGLAMMAGGASAQDDTPDGVPPGSPAANEDVPPGQPSRDIAGTVPDPEQCQVKPVSRSALKRLVIDEDAPDNVVATSTPVDPTEGRHADKETRRQLRATVEELAACNNAGQFLRFLGMFSPDGLMSLGMGLTSANQATYDALSTPVPPPVNQRWGVVAIENARLLDDGRARALVTIDFPEQAGIEPPQIMTFVREGDRWLIDDIAPVP